ncbi:MAG: uroporphyrinogen decarboxylase [Burkholderiaceae bacterium]
MTATVQNDTFLRALRREPTEYTPLWLMRQAGRYLPEYKATRRRAGSFLNLAKTPELACEVTLQPLERYDLDAAILFSDILTVPDAMGLELEMVEGEGPRFNKPLREERDILNLPVPDPNDSLRYVMDAVRTIRSALGGRVPLIGFSGSPWTLACYMIEGQGSKDYQRIKTMMYQRPDLLMHILDVTTEAVVLYLQAQIEAGVQAVMVFDTWGGVLADGAYQRFSLEPMRKVIGGLEPTVGAEGQSAPVPSIVFTKGGGQWLEQIADIGADAVGLDWTVNIGQARARVGDRVALQGNLDPMALMADPAQIQAEAIKVLQSYGEPGVGHGHVFNLGHGISQFTPPQSVTALVEAVHGFSREQRKSL